MFYRLFIVDSDGEQRFAIQNDAVEYLTERGNEWKKLGFIRSYYITPHGAEQEAKS